ncbi:hypothetical protein ABTX61_07390 [Amycolatopsis japonica]|uniref:hypothetical protein n=1 Tax=Amycolatopsis japonica TaxID=208439 RepID=UPI00332C487C
MLENRDPIGRFPGVHIESADAAGFSHRASSSRSEAFRAHDNNGVDFILLPSDHAGEELRKVKTIRRDEEYDFRRFGPNGALILDHKTQLAASSSSIGDLDDLRSRSFGHHRHSVDYFR